MIIYNNNGVVFLDTDVNDSSFLYNEICGSEYVRLDFSLSEYAEIPLGSYIIYRDVQYTLHEAPTIEMVSPDEYKITATFEAPAKQLELYSLRNYVDKRVDFMLTAKPAEHVGMVLEALRVRDKAWALGNCIDAAEKTITYSYVSCMEALKMIADAFDTEWEIIDHTINLGKVEHLKDAPLSISYGKDFGLNPGVGRANLGEARISAVYPQGTDRNINASTYGNPTLLLPKKELIGYDGYRFDDELGYDKSNAVVYSTDAWGTCVFSASGSGVEAEGVLDCTEIYPQREGDVTNVVVRNADSNLYDIQDNTIPASLDYSTAIIPGNELTIVFQTGMLAGKEFGASYIHNGATDSTKRLFQIRPQEYDGVMMPGGNYIPQIGDKYAVFGVALPESYLADNDTKTGASWDMLRKCVKHLYEAEKPQYSFTGELSSKWLRQEINRVSPYLRIGATISFGNVAFQPTPMLVRVESIKQYINTPYSVELTLGDRVIPTPYKITSKTVESRRTVEVKRIASQTAMQINAVKQNAVTPPPTNETVPFANDLTGVIEATPEEFTYRPSAGDKSIRDESAVIKRIKGNTVVFAQLSDHHGDLSHEGDWSVAPEVTANTWGTISKPVQVIAGHKYLFYINKKDGRSITDTYTLLNHSHGKTVYFDSPLFITADETASWTWTARYQTSTNGLRFQTQAFDLTRLFDAGNEPTTIEEFKSKFPNSYYPYSEPEVRNVRTNQITTIGFNAFNGEYADVIGGQAYYLGGAIDTAHFTTEIGGELEEITIHENRLYTPSTNGYIYATGSDICINLSHSGVRNGEYEPYKRNIRLLPEIWKYFPDGMNGNANVWDELNAEYAVKRWGVVDLGTLTWLAQGTNTDGEYRWEAKGISTPPTATVSTIPNIICAKYTTGSNENTFARKDCVSISASGNIRIFDSNYKETSSKEAFVASLQGVLLYYELAEPIETPITEAIQLDYVVDDFGTEKASGYGNSAPFRADIVYQFNAEGRIRDNSRNIERVESNIQRVENTVTTNLTPSQTAMLGLPNKVMTWNGRYAMMSLPIAESIEEWEMEESPLGVLPTGKQVMDYINIIKGSLATGLIPKETITIGANGVYPIVPNKAYEITTASSTTYNVGLYLSTTSGVDIAADNEWRIRIDTRNGFSGRINIEPLESGYTIRWAYPEASGAGTAPTITAGYIWDIQLRMIGKTLLGTYEKY